jgi:hypothetical protein
MEMPTREPKPQIKNLVNLPVIITNVQKKRDKIYRAQIECNEIPEETGVEFLKMVGNYGYMSFKEVPIAKDELDLVPDEIDAFKFEGKTPSQRLRAVIYLLGLQKGRYKEGELKAIKDYYEEKVEHIINSFKEMLDQRT